METLKDARTIEERLWEINYRINNGMYREGTLTQLVNTKHKLEKIIKDKA